MNNRFVKNNIGLLAVVTVCSLVALVALVFVIIYSMEMYTNIQNVKALSNEIRAITNKRPVPVAANKPLIEADIKVYEKANAELQRYFGHPLDAAVGVFLTELTAKKSTWFKANDIDENDETAKTLEDLSNAELAVQLDDLSAGALARKIKELADDDENAAKVKALLPDYAKSTESDLKSRILADGELKKKLGEIFPDYEPELVRKIRAIPEHFTPAAFVEAFNKMLEGSEERNFADRRTRFDDFRRDRFENWSKARAAFIKAAQPCIVEKLTDENADEIMLFALGLPRHLSGESEKLEALKNNIIQQLIEKRVQLTGRSRGLGIVAVADTSAAMGGDAGGGGEDVKNIPAEEYPDIAIHLDIIADMLRRVGDSQGINIWDVQIRLRAGEGENAGRSFKDSKEQRDGFDIYHYTLEISGTMAEIRAAVARLDNSYADRRVYLVKSIYLYAENNLADSIFTGQRVDASRDSENASAGPAATNIIRRRRVRRGAEGVDDSDLGGGNRDLGEEQRQLDAAYKKQQEKLEYYKRDGYGEPIVAASGEKETFRAVIDVEYVVRPGK